MIAAGLVILYLVWILKSFVKESSAFIGLIMLIGYSLMIAGAAKWLWMVAP